MYREDNNIRNRRRKKPETIKAKRNWAKDGLVQHIVSKSFSNGAIS